MARVNNDVVGAQGAITNTVPSLISNTLALIGTLSIMLALEWRLTLLGDRDPAAVHPAGPARRRACCGGSPARG